MQNNSRTPKTCFSLGLECFGPRGISTAIKIALIVALYDFFDDPLAPLNGQLMGPRDSCQMPQNLLYFFRIFS